VMTFFPSLQLALSFVRAMRHDSDQKFLDPIPMMPAALELFDERSLELLRVRQEHGLLAESIPALPHPAHTAVYVEFHADEEALMEKAMEELSSRLETCGGNDQATWLASDEREMEKLHRFRHLVPETVNALIDERRRKTPGLAKLGTDMAVPDRYLEQIVEMYRRDLLAAGLEYVMFGHVGNNHLHVNILPHTLEEYEAGKRLYLQWADEVIRLGGSVSAEHGIGKLKTALLRAMYGDDGIDQMKALKKIFDPAGMLNRGNLFDAAPGFI
ncbi:MAG: FAD-linked oxidase C-terminal domain-containing protein, partial [Lentisphaerota bacterium]